MVCVCVCVFGGEGEGEATCMQPDGGTQQLAAFLADARLCGVCWVVGFLCFEDALKLLRDVLR